MYRAARYVENLLVVLVLLLATLFFVSTQVYLHYGHWPVTHLDYWRIYDICFHHSWLGTALQKVNNHSLFFPSFIWLADLQFFHGDQHLIFYVSLALLTLTSALLLAPVYRENGLSMGAKSAATLVVVVSNFWMGRASIIASGGFNCSASLSILGAVVAFLYLPALAKSPRLGGAIAVILAGAFVSSLSSSTGLGTWPTLLVLAWCIGASRRELYALFAGAVITVAIFLLLPSPVPSITPAPSGFYVSALPWQRLCRLLGSPILFMLKDWLAPVLGKNITSSLFSLVVGLGGLALGAVFSWTRLFRRNLQPGGLEFMGWALLISNLAVMAMIVIGRAALMQTAPQEVAAPRYFFFSTLFWAGLLMVGIARAEKAKWARIPVLSGALALPIFMLPSHCHEGIRYRYADILAETGALSLVSGTCDAAAIRFLFHDPAQVYRVAAELRARRLDMFAAGRQDWVGMKQSELFAGKQGAKGLSGHCRITRRVTCADGTISAQIRGTAQLRGGGAPETLVAISAQGVICGVGKSFVTPLYINRLFYRSAFPVCSFVCFIRDYHPEEKYSVWSVDRGEISEQAIPVVRQ